MLAFFIKASEKTFYLSHSVRSRDNEVLTHHALIEYLLNTYASIKITINGNIELLFDDDADIAFFTLASIDGIEI